MRYLGYLLLTVALLFSCQKKEPPKQKPGQYKTYTLLPNGWRLTPVGKSIPVGELPLNLVVSPDGKFAFTSNSGMGPHSISVIRLDSLKEVQRMPIPKTWRGLALNADGTLLFASGANDDCIRVYSFNGDSLTYRDSIGLKTQGSREWISVTGLAYLAQSMNCWLFPKKAIHSTAFLWMKRKWLPPCP